MKTILVAGSKGGVGKTTVATHLAAHSALQGRRTARLVDPTAAQFSAPALGINVAGHVVDTTDAFLKGRPLVTHTKGATIWCKRNARLDGFRGEMADQPFIDEVAAALVEVVADATRPLGRRAA